MAHPLQRVGCLRDSDADTEASSFENSDDMCKIRDYVKSHFESAVQYPDMEVHSSVMRSRYLDIGIYVARVLRNIKLSQNRRKVAPAPWPLSGGLEPEYKICEGVAASREMFQMIEHQEQRASMRGSMHAYISQATIVEEYDEEQEEDILCSM
jgi:hypothetical protein